MDRAAPADGKLRILHVFRAPVGGLFRYVLDTARGQAERGHDVGIVCDSTTGGVRAASVLAEIEPSLRLGVHRLPIGRIPGFGDLRSVRFMRKLRERLEPDIIHGHGAKGGLLARLPAFFDSAWPATVYTTHGGSFHFLSNAPQDCLYRGVEALLAARTNLFLMESQYIAGRVTENIGERRQPIRVIRHGVTDPEFEPVELGPDPFDVLYLGEMRWLKGVDVLIEALAMLRREGIKLTALLVGAGPQEAEYHALVEKHGLTRDITFEPPQPIRTALARARVIAAPSRGESLSYVSLESTSAAMPMIATRVGGIPEVFGPHADRLIPPDNPAALAEALRTAFAKTEAERRAEAAEIRAYVRSTFNYEGMIDGGLAAYRIALEDRRNRSGAAGRVAFV